MSAPPTPAPAPGAGPATATPDRDEAALTSLREALGAAEVRLLQLAVRGDVLLVARRLVATPAGVRAAPGTGRPVVELLDPAPASSGGSSREAMLERYHLHVGGVLGAPPPGVTWKAGPGLQPIDGSFLDGPRPGLRAVHLTLDGYLVGLVEVRDGDPATPEATDALDTLRRGLARRFDAMTSKLTATALLVLDGAAVAAADRSAAAWVAARGDAAVHTGLDGGALVAARVVERQDADDLRVATVRPVRPPRAPLGLRLTPTERETAPYLASAATLPEIARARGSAPSTLQRHRDNVYEALGVGHRVELSALLRAI